MHWLAPATVIKKVGTELTGWYSLTATDTRSLWVVALAQLATTTIDAGKADHGSPPYISAGRSSAVPTAIILVTGMRFLGANVPLRCSTSWRMVRPS